MMLRPNISLHNTRTNFMSGFTLVEAVIVILIAGIIGAVTATFIRLPVVGYMQSEARIELSNTADTALRRISRDIRLALPNSIRRTTDLNQRVYLEFLLTKTGGRYLAEDDSATTGQSPLSFTDSSATTFTMLGGVPDTTAGSAQNIMAGDFVVVYNLGPGLNPVNAYDSCCNRAEVAAAPVGNTIVLLSNPFASQATTAGDPYFASPDNRFEVIESSPVTYVCDAAAQTLTRISGYQIQVMQPADVTTAPLSSASKALLAKGVIACDFSYDNAINGLNSPPSALVGLKLTIQAPNNKDESVTLFHQVHVDNTP